MPGDGAIIFGGLIGKLDVAPARPHFSQAMATIIALS